MISILKLNIGYAGLAGYAYTLCAKRLIARAPTVYHATSLADACGLLRALDLLGYADTESVYGQATMQTEHAAPIVVHWLAHLPPYQQEYDQ